ncbi:MAG: antitoxin [Clostridia bacterium]|nr:antitoxin [Clostridia bacterium]
MPKTKTSTAVKRRYNEKTYARLSIVVPKSRKEQLEEYAKAHDGSINGLINRLLRDEMGISEKEWKDYLKDAAEDETT